MAAPDFWDDNEAGAKIDRRNRMQSKSVVEEFRKARAAYEDLEVMMELAEEEDDEDMSAELEESIGELKKKMERFELQLLLERTL